MLNFYKKKIMLSVCMDCEGIEYLTTGSPICDDIGSLKNIFSGVDIDCFETISIDKLLKNKHSKIAISTAQMFGFINEWFIHSTKFRQFMPNWSIRQWLIDYLESNIKLLEAGRINCGLDFENNMFTYHEDFAISSMKCDIRKLSCGELKRENCVIFGKDNLRPEFTWLVEDFLANRIDGKISSYWEVIEPVIRANLRNFQFYTDIHKVVTPALINVPDRLTKLYGKDKIEVRAEELEDILQDECAIFLFQTPYMFHNIDTNFVYLQKLLSIYREQCKKRNT